MHLLIGQSDSIRKYDEPIKLLELLDNQEEKNVLEEIFFKARQQRHRHPQCNIHTAVIARSCINVHASNQRELKMAKVVGSHI